MTQAPTRQSGPAAINSFNAWLKQQPWYQQFFTERGINPQHVDLSRDAQSQLERLMAGHGVPIGDGTHIDNAGNVNEKNRLVKNIGIGAGIGGAALTGFGLAGMGPLSGMFGASAAPGLAASVGAPAATEAGIFGGAGAAAGNAAAAGMVGGGAAAASKIPWGTIAKVGGTVAAPAIARSIAGSGGSGNGSGTGSGMNLPPELQQLLQMQLQRIQSAQPNYDLMLNMARGLQPQWARNSTPQNPDMATIIQRLAQPRG